MKSLYLRTLSFSLFFIIIAGFQTLFAGGPGTTGAVALKIPVGARAIAMGQAFVAVADDANAIYWNPAGLNQLGGTHITAEYDVYIDTVRYEFVALGTKLGNDAAFGIGGKFIGTGTDPAYNYLGDPTGQSVGENYMDIDIAGAYRVSYNVDIGLTAKYISEQLVSLKTGTDFAVDLGLLYRTPVKNLTAGFNIQNMAPALKFDQQADPLPFNFKIGVAYKMFENNFTVAYDMNFPNDNAISANLGGEYWYKDTLVGRFGYIFQGSFDQNQVGIGAVAGLFLGAGVKIPAFKNYVGLDYAWTNDGILGANHHFALDFYF